MRFPKPVLVAILPMLAFASFATAAEESAALQLAVPVLPSPVRANGKFHLAYELHFTNTTKEPLKLTRIEILAPDGQAALADYAGATLNNLLQRVKAPQAEKEIAMTPAGGESLAYLWLGFDSETAIPTSLRHRVTFATGSGDESKLLGDPIKLSSKPPIILSPPLRGGPWLAGNGPANFSNHRRAMIPIGDKNFIAQRFAIDWVMLNETGGTFKTDRSINANYSAYGNEALAVADGVVSAVADGIPENVPGLNSRAIAITLENAGGNHVILDLGEGRFGFYAHLQPGSIRVKLGDKVIRGQVLGLVGNSGNSTEPHLHFHVSDANAPLASEGLPYVFDSFQVLGSGWGWTAEKQKPDEKPHLKEIPLLNAVVRFGEAPALK